MASSPGSRGCVRCRRPAVGTDARSLCVDCAHASYASRLPAAQWWTGELRDALRSRDIGSILAAYRHHPAHGHRPLPQSELARWLGISQPRLCRLENHRAQLDDTVLSTIAHILGIPEELLWFDLQSKTPPAQGIAPVRLPSGQTVPASNAATEDPLAETHLATLTHYANLDMLAGPHDLLDVVESQFTTIDSAMRTSLGRRHEKLLYTSARFAEFLGWLHQDAGNLNTAMRWSNEAQNRAEQSGDVQLRAYVLMRKSNIAADSDNTTLAVDLVDEALTRTVGLTVQQRSVLLRQKGHAYAQRTAITGDRRDRRTCVDALAEAATLASDDNTDPNDLAQYCSSGYIAMEAAHCWVQLGRPEKALATLESGLADWTPGNHRDLGMGFARLATAYAGVSQPDQALDVARHALTIHSDTGSHRTIQQLKQVGVALAARGHRSHILDFAAMLRAHMATAQVASVTHDEEFEWS